MEKQSKIREILWDMNENLTIANNYEAIDEAVNQAESQILGLIPIKTSREKILILETSYEKGYWQGRNDCIDEMNEKIKEVRE